jgi:hypothetical protein
MVEFISTWLLLSLPVLLILLVNLKGKQRLIYTHTLLSDFQDRTLGDFLFRTFHLYYDIICDLVLALLLALLLSGLIGFPASRTAAVVDGSYSMLLGPPGQAPLDRALRRLEDGPMRKVDPYLLAFDPRRGSPRLVSLKKLQRRGGLAGAREALTAEYSFFNQDYRLCEALLARGYGRVLVLSDHEAAAGGSVELLAVGRGRPESFFYPRSVGYDFDAGVFRLAFQLWNLAEPVTAAVYREGGYLPAADAEMRLSPDLLICLLPEEGLYKFAAGNLDFVFALQKPVIPVRVEGKFSRVILDVLPQLEEDGGGLLLADLSYREPASEAALRREIRGLGKFRRALITFIPEGPVSSGSYIYPLVPSLSCPGLTELPAALLGLEAPGAELFYQNPPALTDAQTPIVYLGSLERGRPPAYVTLPEGKPALAQRHLSSFVYRRGDAWVPVNLAAEELYPPEREPPLRFAPPAPRRQPVFWLLVCCYVVKSVLLAWMNRPPAGKRA